MLAKWFKEALLKGMFVRDGNQLLLGGEPVIANFVVKVKSIEKNRVYLR